MAAVVLTQSWLTLVATPSVSLKGYTDRDRTEQFAVAGSVRQYAGGRRRLITTPATEHSVSVTMRNLTPADYATLQSWTGQLLMYRDNTGRKLFGTFFSLPEGFALYGKHDVKIDFESITFSEAV